MLEKDKTTELPEARTQTEATETAQTPEAQKMTKAPEQQAAEQANEKATAEDLAEQEKNINEALVTQQTKTEAQEVLNNDQKAQEVQRRLEELSKTVKPDPEGNIIITAEQLRELDTIDSLLKITQEPQSTIHISERTLLVNDKTMRKEIIKSLKKEIKAEKRAKSDFKKIANLEAQLAQIKNTNNYHYQKASLLEQINQALETGIYINTPIAFLKENPLIIDLYKNKNKIKAGAKTTLSYQGKPLEIYNQTLLQKDFNQVNGYIQSCGGYANIAEKLVHENTKMSH